jgi:hypothetical protein
MAFEPVSDAHIDVPVFDFGFEPSSQNEVDEDRQLIAYWRCGDRLD